MIKWKRDYYMEFLFIYLDDQYNLKNEKQREQYKHARLYISKVEINIDPK